MVSKIIIYLVGVILFFLGVWLSVVNHNPHFYTPFSVGIFIILTQIYFDLKGSLFFKLWSFESFVFLLILLIGSIVTDKIGLHLNYWSYPHYYSLFDEFLKIVFEFVFALICFPFVSLVGAELLFRLKIKRSIAWIFSFVFLPPLFLLFTEQINKYSDSWVYHISPIVWYTLGAWLMVFVPLIAFWLTKKVFEK